MFEHPKWLPALIVAAALVCASSARGFAFMEKTIIEGEVKSDVNGVWLVVSHLEFPNPTPTPDAAAAAASPAASASPADLSGAAQKKDDAAAGSRTFNVINLLKIVHRGKAGAQAMREEEERREQASVAKAKQIIAEEQKKSGTIPVQTETGEVEGEAKVVVPTTPPVRQISPDDYADVGMLEVEFPKHLQDAVDKATKEGKPWIPSSKDLAELKSSWSGLPTKKPSEYSKIEWKVTAAEKFDENLQADPETKDALFMISANEEMIPKPGVPKSNVLVFGVRKVAGDTMEGGHVRAMMASAPFPIPIEMKGSFKMYRVADVPKADAGPASAAPAQAPKATKRKGK